VRPAKNRRRFSGTSIGGSSSCVPDAGAAAISCSSASTISPTGASSWSSPR